MFSGIVSHKAKIEEIKDTGAGRVLTLSISKDVTSRLKKGASILLNGVCFTALTIERGRFTVEAMPQTIRSTTVGSWEKGDTLNAEPSLRVGDEIGGHFVFGHVDCLGEVVKIGRDGTSYIMEFKIDPKLLPYLPPRASVSVNGISLTVVDRKEDSFRVSLLPHTLDETDLKDLTMTDFVNIEIDMLSRYANEHIHNN